MPSRKLLPDFTREDLDLAVKLRHLLRTKQIDTGHPDVVAYCERCADTYSGQAIAKAEQLLGKKTD